jgi:uncharacterized protein with NRDE domain
VCTIIALTGLVPGHPVVIAANRDELYARPALPPAVLSRDPLVVGGRDAARHGTWMGATAGGFFVGVTNQRPAAARSVAPRSRGELVLRALQQGSGAGVRALLAEIDPAQYLPFNLIFGDASGLQVAYGRTDGVTFEEVPPGLEVLHNDRLHAPAFAWKAARTRAVAEAALRAPDPLLALHPALADRELPPLDAVPEPPPGSPFDRELLRQLQAIEIHTPGYGTRSSTIVALSPGRVDRYLFGDGPASSAALQDVTALLAG